MSGNIALTIYYPLPKMNPKNISHLVFLYFLDENSSHSIHNNSVHYFSKDYQERSVHSSPFSSTYYPNSSKKYFFHSVKKKEFKTPLPSSTVPSTTPSSPPSAAYIQEIEKEWSKLSPLLLQLHLFHSPLLFLSSLPINDCSWNFIHYFPLNPIPISSMMTIPPVTNVYSKYYTPSTGLFLLPHSFYLSTLQYSDLILSLYELSEEQIVYLTLFALLVQNPKGSFVLKLKSFYTPLIMDVLYLLSCVYNKVILLPLDYVNYYVICKGFQMDFIKPHITQIKNVLYSLRPNSLQRIVINKEGNSSRRIFSMPLPALFVSKIEEINVLVHHKQLIYLND
jgi:hypothetical protein